jgi:hypothetical protein
MRLLRWLVTLVSLMGGITAVAQSAPLTERQVSMFVGCVRSRSWNMLGSKHFATGDTVTIKYLFKAGRSPEKRPEFYFAVVNSDGDFGRVFLFRKFDDGWWAVNDANFDTRPRWKLTSEPLGGGNTAGLMDGALAEMQQRTQATSLKLAPIERQPQGCSTYLQR